MTFIERIESLSERFLSDRAYELIVAPALADVEYDESGILLYPARDRRSVLVAFAGAMYSDFAASSIVLTLAGLSLIPATYYLLFMMVLSVPLDSLFRDPSAAVPFAAAIAVLSVAPVLACCWPERSPRRRPHPDAADA